MEEVIALFGEFGTSVLQPGAVISLAITVILFILEVRWSRAHPPRSRRAEKAKALSHVVTARRVKYWDDGVSPDEKTTSQYHATYAYEVAGKQYQYKYLERAVPPVQIQLYYLDKPARYRIKQPQGIIRQTIACSKITIMYCLHELTH